jgi:hypothetical protein
MLITHSHLAPTSKEEYSYVSTTALGLHGLFQSEFYLFLSNQVISVKALRKNKLAIEFPRFVSDNKCMHI